MQMIDEPDLFAPLATWEQFLMQLHAMDQTDPSVQGAILLAQRVMLARQGPLGKDIGITIPPNPATSQSLSFASPKIADHRAQTLV